MARICCQGYCFRRNFRGEEGMFKWLDGFATYFYTWGTALEEQLWRIG
jgi:hypothetical protein